MSATLKPGKLRHRGLVEKPTPAENDSDGELVQAWEPVFNRLVSMDIAPLSGRELVAGAAVQSKVTTRIKVRFHAAWAASMRITHRGTIYNIEAVVPDPESGVHFQNLLCSSGVNLG